MSPGDMPDIPHGLLPWLLDDVEGWTEEPQAGPNEEGVVMWRLA
jgi:hypothetical protein